MGDLPMNSSRSMPWSLRAGGIYFQEITLRGHDSLRQWATFKQHRIDLFVLGPLKKLVNRLPYVANNSFFHESEPDNPAS